MNILLIVDDYMPNSIKIGAKMMHELAIEFTNRNHNVTVITPDSTLKEKYQINKLDDVTIYRFKNGVIKNTSKAKRAINETLLSYNAWRNLKYLLKKENYDLIVYYSPTIFFGSLVKKLKKLYGAPSYLILRDFFPQWIIDAGIIKENSVFAKYFRLFEGINYKYADFIALQSPKNLEVFSKQYKKTEKLKILFNWTVVKTINKDNKNIYRKKLSLENKVLFFYGGNIGHAQDMMNIVRLANNMKIYKTAHFLLIGKGDEYDLVETKIKELKLDNLTLLPSVSQEEFAKILSEVDIGLFSLHKNHTAHNFPGKLLGYMANSLPILGSINKGNDLKDTVEEFKSGFVTTNGEDEKLLNNAVKLLKNKKLRIEMGQNARNMLINKFSVNSAVSQILKTIL